MSEPVKPTSPVCAKCGNDGSAAALYLTVDAKWSPETRSWILEAREDSGGQEIDCLACDHRTEVDDMDETGLLKSGFPYGAALETKA